MVIRAYIESKIVLGFNKTSMQSEEERGVVTSWPVTTLYRSNTQLLGYKRIESTPIFTPCEEIWQRSICTHQLPDID